MKTGIHPQNEQWRTEHEAINKCTAVGHRKKKQSYSNSLKMKVAKYHAQNKDREVSFADTARHFRFQMNTAKTFWNRSDKYKGMESDERRWDRKAKYPALENELFNFINVARNNPLPVTGAIIMEKASSLPTKHNIDENEFHASQGWMYCFSKRKIIQNAVCFCGEAGSVEKCFIKNDMLT